ncbi:MAG: histidine phosphatase family protein [Thermodesulfobacteriota bacterium]
MVNHTESSTTRILLIRHGETDWNRLHRFQGRSDLPLNQKGRDQARALALGLKDQSLTAIYSSPLARAVETADLIKVFHPSVPLFKEEGLVEMDLGEFEGIEAGHWVVEHSDFLKSWRETPASIRMPGGENLQEVQARAISTLERIAKLYPTESTLLLCSHNFVNLTILCHALQIPLDRFREVRQETAALNVLHMQGEQLVAKVVNDRSHLKDRNDAK